uniref:Thyroglobulin type-1 domain-containing protein n=1 Tax=Arion vulgaris TaxID=1028688 RepID=A0A0B7B1B8_9EUPU
MKACTNQVCPGNPEAVCVVDLCSSTCKIKFIDASGQNVMCTDDKCQVFSFNEQDTCSDKCPASNVKICPESVCELAMKQNCSKKHCAVCVLDPCTCQPSFIDVRTRKNLTNVQCNYLSESICELKRCDILSNIEKAKFSGIDLTSAETALPECDDHGKFNPKQCQGQSCQCVDQFGRSTGETSAGSCREIDEIVILYVTLTYNANYSEYKSNDKLKVLQDMIWKKLQDAGIDPRIIKKVGEPYPGSVKVDVTFQNNADSYNKDMALITNTIKQMANTNGLDLTIDGQTVNLVNITEQVQTQSQVADNGNKIEDEDELSQTEKIIIGVVVGVVGLLIIAVIVFCLCYRRKQQKEAMDDSFETIRESKRSSESSLVSETNKVYQEDDNIVKVRL